MDTNTAWQTLRDYAEGRIGHTYAGSCPDSIEGPAVRDPECLVCQALDAAQGCPTQIEEPAQPVAEICSASHDDAEFGERAIKPLCDISGFEYGTPLYAGAAPAAVAPQGERQWICPTRTVADLVNNLLTLDQALPAYGAQYIEKDGRRCAIAVPPTVSRERVKDGRWIGQGEELNAAVIWTRAERPAAEVDLRKALQFYADGEHFILSDETAWDTVSGEPQNYWCDEAGTATVEDGTIAKMALAGQPIDFEEDDAAPKLEAPAGPEATDAAIDAIVLRQTGFDGDGYQAMTADELRRIVRSALGELAAAPQAPAAPDDVLCYIRPGATLPERHGFEVCRATDAGAMAVMGDGRAHAMPTVTPAEFAADIDQMLAAPAAPAVDASDTALLDAMERERIAVIPEFEGPWDAQIYGEDETTLACGSGATPRKAIAEALSSLEARKAHDAAQAKEGGA